MKLPYTHVDAFADRPFTGNQAAVMPLEAWPADGVLQAIGGENNFAETAFTVPADGVAADYELRWFTPAVEIGLCGHATLAAGHVLIGARDRIRFATLRAGVLEVVRDGDALALSLPALPPAGLPVLPFGGNPFRWADWLGTAPVEHLFHAGGYHLLRFADAAAVAALSPDFRALLTLGDAQIICTAPGAGHASGADVVSRVFVPGAGVDEDSVTGSAHAVLTPYWAAQLGRDRFTAFQASARGGHLACRRDGDRAWLGGACVTVVEGVFHVPDALMAEPPIALQPHFPPPAAP
jgi:predicted PhzF superfamily epimerase YddE/YHI9